MELTDDLKYRDYDSISTNPIVYSKSFEDKSSALGITRLPNMWPRTKEIIAIYHHFREYVRLGMI